MGRIDAQSIVGSASIANLGTQGRSQGQTAPQNGRKPYQFQPGNPYAWKPGVSGNPAGRPSGDVKQITREFGEEYDPKMGKTHDEHFMGLLYRRGCQGNMKAAELWAGYRWGRPNQALEVETTVNYTDTLTRMKEARRRLEEHRAGLPAAAPTNGHADPATALLAAQLPDQDLSAAREDDAEQPAATQPKITVEL